MLRNASQTFINRWKGLNSYQHLENLSPQAWLASNNVVVNQNGSAEALRSPKGFNTALTFGTPIISMADYANPYEERLIFDINASSGSNVKTYKIENDFSNTLLRSGQGNYPWISLVVNLQLFRLNPAEFIQHTVATPPTWAAWDVFKVGVDEPAAAPTISYQAGGTGEIVDSIQVSYAYMNSRTGGVSRPCPISNQLLASGANKKVRVPTVASAQHGVDKLVFFFTVDAGSQPYLLIDSSGDPVTKTNATANYDFDIGTLAWDTLTPEPIFNYVPPLGANFAFQWKDHMFLMGFDGSAIPTTDIAYSALESCYIGNPAECYPPLNRLAAPNKGEVMSGGTATQLGALLLSDRDAYLLEGYPADKTSGPEATTAVSEVLAPLNWKIGTKSPRTIRNTPFGTVWLDQALRLRLWNGSTAPTEVGLPLRTELANLDKSAVGSVEGQWYQFGKQGGLYVLCGKDSVSNAQKFYFMTLYEDPETGELRSGFGVSDVAAYSLQPVWYNGSLYMFMGAVNQVKTFFDPSQAGDGWGGKTIYFDVVLGNENNFQYWHSLRIDGDVDLSKLTVTVRDVTKDGSGNTVASSINTARTLTINSTDEGEDGSYYGMIDEYGRRKVLRFAFDSSVDTLRQIKNLAVFYSKKKRVM